MSKLKIEFKRNTRAEGKSFAVGQVASINKKDAEFLVRIGKAALVGTKSESKAKK